MSKDAMNHMRGKIDKRLDAISDHYTKEGYERLLRAYYDLALGPNLNFTLDGKIETIPFLMGIATTGSLIQELISRGFLGTRGSAREQLISTILEMTALPPTKAENSGPRNSEAVYVQQSAFGFNSDLTIDQVLDAGHAFGLDPATAELPLQCALSNPRGSTLFAAKPYNQKLLMIVARRKEQDGPITYRLAERECGLKMTFTPTQVWTFERPIKNT